MLKKLQGEFAKILQAKNFNGTILIALKGDVVFEQAYGMADFAHHVKNRLDTKYKLASITKSLTATAILKLIETGKLKFDTTVKDIIPDFPNGEKITVHHILSNTSGLAGFDLWGDFYEAFKADNVDEALIDMFKFEKLEFEPGEKYDYSNSGYFLLGYIIEKVTGKKYEDYLVQEVLRPVGIENVGFSYYQEIIENLATGYDLSEGKKQVARFMDMRIAGGGGALYGTVRSVYDFDRLLLAGKIIAPELVEKMKTSYVDIIENTGYGYGWFVVHEEMFGKTLNEIYHTGGGPGIRTINAVFTDYDLQIIMLSNVNDRDGFHGAFDQIEELCLKTLNNQ